MLAVILKKNIFAEGSEVVTLYSRDEGKVRAVARSVKSAKSKLSFGLQDLFLSDVEVAVSSGAMRSHSLPVITGVKPLNTFMHLRESDVAVHLALYATELLLKSTPDHEPQPSLYEHFVSYLEHLDSVHAHPMCRTCYTLKFLELIGYGLDLEHCAACKKRLPEDSSDTAYFSTAKSGFVCAADAANSFGAKPVSAAALRLLASTAAQGFAEQDAAAESLPEQDLHAVSSVIQDFAIHVIERELKTVRYL